MDSGIANSGSSGMYFAPRAPTNYVAATPTIGVHVANGTPVHSIASGELALVNALLPASRKGHLMAGFPLLDWLPLLVRVFVCYLPTQESLPLIGTEKSSLMVGVRLPAPNFGVGPSSHRYPPPPHLPQEQL